MTNKKGQGIMGLPFSMIFSLFLIVFFIVIAFIAIDYFLDLRDCTQIGLFVQDLKEEVNQAYNSPKYGGEGYEFVRPLPQGLEYICFSNLSMPLRGELVSTDIGNEISDYDQKNNLFLYPKKKSCGIPYHRLRNINLNKITSVRNPRCIEIKDGKISLNIEKSLTEGLVGIF